MEKLVTLCLVLVLVLFVVPASAQNPVDSMGLYFDTHADVACAEGVSPFTMLTMYLIYSNPTITELNGFELGITVVGTGATFLSCQTACGISINPVQQELEQIQVACATAVPCVENTVLMTMEWFYTSTTSEIVLCYLHGAENPSQPGDFPLVLPGDGTYLAVGVNEIGSHLTASGAMTSMFDVCYPLATQSKSWDSLKSLYR